LLDFATLITYAIITYKCIFTTDMFLVLEVCSLQGAIQIHVYLYLYLYFLVLYTEWPKNGTIFGTP